MLFFGSLTLSGKKSILRFSRDLNIIKTSNLQCNFDQYQQCNVDQNINVLKIGKVNQCSEYLLNEYKVDHDQKFNPRHFHLKKI